MDRARPAPLRERDARADRVLIVGAPDFFNSARDPQTGQLVIRVPEGRFPRDVLEATGSRYLEIAAADARPQGEGVWVGVSRDPENGLLTAVSHTRSNSAALAD